MKKLFSSAISLTAVMALLCGSGYTALFAAAATTDVIEYDGEEAELYYFDSESLSITMPDTPSIQSNYGELSYNYGDFTDANNSAVYEALSVWTEPSLDMITVELPEKITLTLSGLPGSEEYTEEDAAAFSEAIFANSKPGIDSMFFDMPEICWLDASQLAIGISDATTSYSYSSKKYTLKIKSLTFTPALEPALETLEEANEYVENLQTAVDTFEVEGDTRYEQLKSIHDTICTFTYYDTEADFASSALGALVEPGVVCEGYSEGLKLICDSLGIPCVLVFGNYDRELNVAHMWNYVMMEDGKWYAIDATWDDLDGEDGKELKYDYFLKGSESFSANHTADPDFNITYFTYPELAADDYLPAGTSETTTTTTTTTTSSETTTTTTTTSETTTTTTTTPETTTTTTTSETTTTTTTTPETTTTTPETTTTTTTTSETTTTTTTTVYLRGDFNKDGEVNAADLVLCARTAIRLETDYNCDYNGDGCTDVFDVILMRKHLFA